MSATTTIIKTLEATLAPPTAHKERRLRRTEATYRRALRDAFESGAGTQTAVNDVVTGYDLSSYAKDRSNNTSRNSDAPTTPRNWRGTTPFGSRTGGGKSITRPIEPTSSAGGYHRPDAAPPSGFRCESTLTSGSCGTDCTTVT